MYIKKYTSINKYLVTVLKQHYLMEKHVKLNNKHKMFYVIF